MSASSDEGMSAPTGRRGGPVAPRPWAESAWAKLAIRIVVAGVITFVISTVLARFSGTSLLFPEAWREVVVFVASVAGVMFFETGYRYRARRVEAARHTHGRSADRCDKRNGSSEIASWPSWAALAVMVASISVFLWLRTRCVYHFDPAPWLATQLAAERASVEATAKSAGSHGSESAETAGFKETPADAARRSSRRDKAEAAVVADADAPPSTAEELTPEFVNAKKNLICVPLWLPEQDRRYVEHVERERHYDGMRILLDEQPGLVINWLSGEARANVMWTTWVFMLNYFVCVASSLFLLGLRFEPVETIWGAIFQV